MPSTASNSECGGGGGGGGLAVGRLLSQLVLTCPAFLRPRGSARRMGRTDSR